MISQGGEAMRYTARAASTPMLKNFNLIRGLLIERLREQRRQPSSLDRTESNVLHVGHIRDLNRAAWATCVRLNLTVTNLSP